MKLLLILLFVCCFSCQPDKPKAFYEITVGEELVFQLKAFKGEPYYWELTNENELRFVKLSSRIYETLPFSSEKKPRALENWTFEGLKTGTDTLKLHLRTYEEDTLNVPVADSVIITISVTEAALF